MSFDKISQITEFIANVITIFGIPGIPYIYKIWVYDRKNYKFMKSPEDIPMGEVTQDLSAIAYQPNIKIEDINKGRIKIITKFSIK